MQYTTQLKSNLKLNPCDMITMGDQKSENIVDEVAQQIFLPNALADGPSYLYEY